MVIIGLIGNFIEVNQSFCDFIGYSNQELEHLTVYDITHKDDVELTKSHFQQILKGHASNLQHQKRYICRDGSLKHVLKTLTAIYDDDGNLQHTIGLMQDITAIVQQEEKEKQMRMMIQKHNESLLNFAHIVSHNLKSQTNNISSLSQILKTEKDPNEVNKIIPMINSSTAGLTTTIEHLSELVDIRLRAESYNKPLRLIDFIKKATNNVSVLIEKEEADINISVSDKHFILGLPSYVESILLNVLTNALKYRKPNVKPIIAFEAFEKENTIELHCKDNGLGIDLQKHGKKVFGMYKTFHKHKEANGIGLFISKNQIEAMGGSITLESKVDEGSNFILSFKKHN